MTKSDTMLQRHVEDELRWDPAIEAAHIGVAVDGGAVTLFGHVRNHAEVWAAERAARRVAGVRTIARELTVLVPEDHQRSDTEIAAAVEHALRWNVLVPTSVTATVEKSAVTLEGEVHWNFQRDAAEQAVRTITGVVALHNYVTLRPAVLKDAVQDDIEATLARRSPHGRSGIRVAVSGSQVVLSGTVTSYREVADAVDAARAAAGVTEVVNELRVLPD